MRDHAFPGSWKSLPPECEACGETYDSAEYWEGQGQQIREREIADVVVRLATLALNLAWAASLCQSFRLGILHPIVQGETWSPGCGKAAP